MDEIQRADPRARRKALILLGCGLLVGLAVTTLLESYGGALADWITRDPEQTESRFRLAFTVLAVAFAPPILTFAVYLWRLGERIVEAERFPPPGLAVATDTVILRGMVARWRGRFMQLLAVVLVLAASGFAIFVWRLLSLVRASAA